ncbi:MAG: hypothetical protein ACLQPH_11715 [Acidimicrobiales bacterium]
MRTHRGLVVLLAVPVVVVGIPRLFGMAFLAGDNFVQNFPMRVLVGQDLDHGTLPLWNPYLSSGTPLLAGFNAGAAYPLTWLTAVFDGFTAWGLTLVVAYDLAVLGMYLFLRRQTVSSTAATFGAATFAFAGYFTAQQVHIDLIEGAAWLPWMLLAVHGLTEPPGPPPTPQPTPRPLRHWAALLAVSLGLCLLSGGVEAIIDSAIVVAIYGAGRLVSVGWLHRARRARLPAVLGAAVVGAAGGLALGAAQWIPGLAFSSQSQRAVHTYAFFTSGTLQIRLLTLVMSPFVLGTNQGWPSIYVGTYNFPEVTSYAGVLALIAACSLFLQRWRRSPEARHWWVWYVVLVVGILSALGSQTPFAHLLFLIPGVDGQRLINRNLLLVDVALAVLLGWWVHLLVSGHGEADPTAPTLRERWRRGPRSDIVTPSLPFAVSVLLCLFLWVDGPLLYRWLESVQSTSTTTRLQLAGLVTVVTVVAGAATWVVLCERRTTTVRLVRRLGAVLAADLVVFNLFVIQPPITEATAHAREPLAATLASTVGDGRFILYDPDQFEPADLYALGQTDLNIFTGLPSAQGYTALTDGEYYRATGAHLQDDLDPRTLTGPVWGELNVTTLLSLPTYFVRRVPGSALRPTVPAVDIVPFPGPAASTGRAVGLSRGGTHRWYFGGVLTVDRLRVPVGRGTATGLRVALVTPAGAVRWLPQHDLMAVRSGAGPSHLEVAVPDGTRAAGIVVGAGPTTTTLGVPTAWTDEAGEVTLDGPLQPYVTPPHWTYTGTIGVFGVFHDASPGGWARLRTPEGGPAPASSWVTAAAPDATGAQQITVHATGAVAVQRSEAWSPGWTATVRPLRPAAGGAAAGGVRTVPVVRSGVLQQVELPGAGDYRITFTYFPHAVPAGLAVSAAAGGALVVWAALETFGAVRSRRRRRTPGIG